MATPNDDYDTPWKQALERYFPEFLAFYFPDAHAAVDWSRPHVFLDQELARLRRGKGGKRIVDKLVQLHTLDGDASWVLVHVEIQGRRERAFAERVFTCNYRLYDRYRRPVASLAVLADPGPRWRPDVFEYSLFGSRMRLAFQVAKLSDYGADLDALCAHPNPYALVTAAHLLTQHTRGQARRRRRQKWRLAKLLYQRAWDKQRIIDLFLVIDWMMQLPEQLDRRLWQGIEILERRGAMPYVSSVERLGRKAGREEGLKEGLKEGMKEGRAALLAVQLSHRFGPLDADAMQRLAQASVEQLEQWALNLMQAGTLREVFRDA